MPRIAIYDPAGCCSTGVCDPAMSEDMAQFAAAIEGLTQQGVEVERYELSSQPGAFVQNTVVKGALDSHGVECLPLIIVDGEIVSKGAYLNRADLSAKVGIEIAAAGAPAYRGDGDDKAEETKDTSTSSCCA